VSYPGATVTAMVAVAWAAIGILAATLLGSLYYLGARIDALGSSLNARIDGLESSLNARIDGLSGRINGLESSLNARIDALAARMDAHIERHVG
jgi:outer membrane murein-binding lipoprotein Lpp